MASWASFIGHVLFRCLAFLDRCVRGSCQKRSILCLPSHCLCSGQAPFRNYSPPAINGGHVFFEGLPGHLWRIGQHCRPPPFLLRNFIINYLIFYEIKKENDRLTQ